jgi:membrane protease YdiL (CAAX protease family)
VLVIIALSGDSWRSFGITRPKWIIDVLGALAISLAASTAYSFVLRLLPPSFLHSLISAQAAHRAGPKGIAGVLLLVVAQAADGFSEELVMRAYLIVRLERLLSSRSLAVVVTTAIFASYHVYQGTLGTISAAIIGLINAIVFCWFRRLWPLCLAHAAHNIWIGVG